MFFVDGMYIFKFTTSKQVFTFSVAPMYHNYTFTHLPTRPILNTLVSCKQINWDTLCNALSPVNSLFLLIQGSSTQSKSELATQ